MAGGGSANALGFPRQPEGVVKVRHKKKPLLFGDWIVRVYDVCGDRRAPTVVQLAVNRRAVTFREQQRFIVL
jgi:hypothetical protein